MGHLSTLLLGHHHVSVHCHHTRLRRQIVPTQEGIAVTEEGDPDDGVGEGAFGMVGLEDAAEVIDGEVVVVEEHEA